MSSDLQIVHPRLRFETEYGRHRNWWVRDPRIAGVALSMYLFLLSQDPAHPITQTEARRVLGLGKDAWATGKRKLLQAGFLVEIRDRYPAGFVDSSGRPRGLQRRFRLFLDDPEEGTNRPESETVIELSEPYETYLENASAPLGGFPALGRETAGQVDGGIAAEGEIPRAENPHRAENPPSLIGREEDRTGLDRDLDPIPSDPGLERARAAERSAADTKLLDQELAMIHPTLSTESLTRELRGRVDLRDVNVVLACRAILDANKQPQGVLNPPAYVAKSLASDPTRYPAGSTPYIAGSSVQESDPRNTSRARQEVAQADCRAGEHDWGASYLPEIDRAHCVRCGTPRRQVDAAYAEFEVQHDLAERGAN